MEEKKPLTECTISEDLLDAWKKLRRVGDPEKIAAETGFSRPTIDRALKFGYVAKQELPDLINKFFMERMEREKEQALKMIAQAEELAELKKQSKKKVK